MSYSLYHEQKRGRPRRFNTIEISDELYWHYRAKQALRRLKALLGEDEKMEAYMKVFWDRIPEDATAKEICKRAEYEIKRAEEVLV
jgi:hypothetical protein